MANIFARTWLRFGVWLIIGLLIYGFYGVRYGRAQGQQLSPLHA